jgi:predicted DNA-binding transcriptional regulator YafY
MGDPALAEAAISVLAKVAATLPDDRERHLFHAISHVYRPETHHASAPEVDLIRQACWREEALTIRYADKAKAVTERTIYPLALVYTERALTVLAWCCLREAFRMFRLDGIVELHRAGTSFRPKRVTLLREYLTDLAQRPSAAPTR